MIGKILLVTLLAFTMGQSAFSADDEGATVTVRGRLNEDKFGYFVQANGATYDLVFADSNKTDMHKFYGDLKGDYVSVTGSLYVDDTDKSKARLTVYANDIARLKRTVVVEPPPVIVREGYIEHRRHGIDLPGVHIHW